MKMRWYTLACAACFLWLLSATTWTAEENTKPTKEMIKPVRNGVQVFTSSRVLIGVLDKEAEVEVLLKTDQWCKVQYTKDGNRFVGWVLKEDLAFTDTPPPNKEEEKGPRPLSLQETSEQLRKLVRVGVSYKSTRGEGWNPNRRVGVPGPTEAGNVEIKLTFTDKGTPAKISVLKNFRKDHAIELYVEDKIVELKHFREIAHPDFDRIIMVYIRALESYNDNRVPDFNRHIDSAERFWNVIDSQMDNELSPIMYAPL